MADDYVQRRRVGWQDIAALVAIVLALLAGSKTWFLNDYRLDQIEQDVHGLKEDLKAQNERILRQELTYRALLQEAKRHGWTISEEWSSGSVQ